MVQGLFWSVLLVCFAGLAWAGWREYQKLEAYRPWAQQFERAKYDIYAVLGQRGNDLTWGKPTPKGPVDLVTFSLQEVEGIQLCVDHQRVELNALPSQGQSILLEFQLRDRPAPMQIPFTEIPLAANWARHLQQDLQTLLSQK